MTELNHDQCRQLCVALGWQGGTFWQVLDEVRRLRRLRAHSAELLKCMEQFTGEMTVGERYTNAGQAALDSLPLLRASVDTSDQPAIATPTDTTIQALARAAGFNLVPTENLLYTVRGNHAQLANFARLLLGRRQSTQPADKFWSKEA